MIKNWIVILLLITVVSSCSKSKKTIDLYVPEDAAMVFSLKSPSSIFAENPKVKNYVNKIFSELDVLNATDMADVNSAYMFTTGSFDTLNYIIDAKNPSVLEGNLKSLLEDGSITYKREDNVFVIVNHSDADDEIKNILSGNNPLIKSNDNFKRFTQKVEDAGIWGNSSLANQMEISSKFRDLIMNESYSWYFFNAKNDVINIDTYNEYSKEDQKMISDLYFFESKFDMKELSYVPLDNMINISFSIDPTKMFNTITNIYSKYSGESVEKMKSQINMGLLMLGTNVDEILGDINGNIFISMYNEKDFLVMVGLNDNVKFPDFSSALNYENIWQQDNVLYITSNNKYIAEGIKNKTIPENSLKGGHFFNESKNKPFSVEFNNLDALRQIAPQYLIGPIETASITIIDLNHSVGKVVLK